MQTDKIIKYIYRIVKCTQHPQLIHGIQNRFLHRQDTKKQSLKNVKTHIFFFSKKSSKQKQKNFTCGGGSIKSKSSKFRTPRDFNRSTTLAKLIRCISGILLTNISCRNAASVKSRKHVLSNKKNNNNNSKTEKNNNYKTNTRAPYKNENTSVLPSSRPPSSPRALIRISLTDWRYL